MPEPHRPGRSDVPYDQLRADRRADQGSAVVEFVLLGLVLLVPLVYLVLILARIQAGAFAADAAARAAARTFVRADDEDAGRALALAAVRLALSDQGFDDDPVDAARMTCSAVPCLTPEGTVTVQVNVQVALPGLPAVIASAAGTQITVRSEHTSAVDAFRFAGPPP